MIELSRLGRRIAIIGASNGGKSTLAAALGRKLGLPITHLDQLYHQPHTDWRARPEAEFLRLHDAAISDDSWVVEGNYSSRMPQRFQRASAVIWLDAAPVPSAVRYIRRTLFEQMRFGKLEGATDRLKWSMIRYIVLQQPGNRAKYESLLAGRNFPVLRLKSMRDLNGCYRHWQLDAAL